MLSSAFTRHSFPGFCSRFEEVNDFFLRARGEQGSWKGAVQIPWDSTLCRQEGGGLEENISCTFHLKVMLSLKHVSEAVFCAASIYKRGKNGKSLFGNSI